MRRMNALYVVGAGGIGCAVGHALCVAGWPAVFVDADAAKVAWGNAHGVCIAGHAPQRARFVVFPRWNPARGDTVLLCTKCYDNATVLSRLPAGIELIPIQNGFDPDLDARNHPVEGVASFVSECDPHRSRTRLTRRGALHFGHRQQARDDGMPPVVRALEKAISFRVRLVADILPYKYTKLMYNAAISPLAAALGLDNGRLLAVPAARQLFFELLRENYAILRHAGIRLGKVGPFHPDTVQRILRRRRLANALAWVFYPSLRNTYCSMANDLPAGRTEIDFYNRHLIDLAGDHPCPLNRRVHELVKRMERQRLPPGPHLMRELL
jgi:2-dehydropantoate 2-reductase